ncbi:MAG: PAS domain S-box protein, partial [Magnetococcales bacterium]|nr:PAS domain S-box protein [Magnetococcales bacterium]
MDHKDELHISGINHPIILSFMATFGGMLVVFLFSLHWMHLEQEEAQSGIFHQQVAEVFQRVMHENYLSMEGQMEILSRDRELATAFLQGDRTGLQRLAHPLLERWKKTQGISIFSFHNLDGSNFLRVHNPTKFGDVISRRTLIEAKTNGRTARGVELSSLNSLTIRLVLPWEVEGRVIGYLETGKEWISVLNSINTAFHTDIYLFLYKKFLVQSEWQAWMRYQNRDGDWERFPDVVSAEGSERTLSDEMSYLVDANETGFGTFQRSQGEEKKIGHLHYFIDTVSDIDNRQVGKLIALYDDRLFELISSKHKRQVVMAITLCALFMGLMFYRQFLRTGANLRLATDRLRLSEERNRAILDTAWDAIISIDVRSKIIDFNRAAERIFGISKQDVLGMDVSDVIIPPEMRDDHRQGMERYLATGERRLGGKLTEMEAIDRNGRKIPVEFTVTAIHDTVGTFFTAFLRDISERKQILATLNDAIKEAEDNNLSLRREVVSHQRTLDRLQGSEERFRSVTQSIRDAVIAADQEQSIVFWNLGAEKLFGYSSVEIIGQAIGVLVPERLLHAHRRGFKRFVDEGFLPLIGSSIELTGLRKDGREFPLELSVNHWTQADGTRIFSAVIRDITERRMNEEALMVAKERAEAANKAKSLFLANISHEIRTPMNTIVGMGYLLSHSPLSAVQRGQMETIQQAAEMLLGIINDLLDYSKIAAGRMELDIV